jgi:uncharacterized membrane protein HdeD (DUF308 family)
VVSRFRRSADDSWCRVCGKGADRNNVFNSRARLGARDQRSVVVRKCISRFSWHGFFFYLLNAIIRGVTGYLLISHPDAGDAGDAGVTLVLASLFIVGGLFRGAAASVIRFPSWAWTAFSGLVSVVLGIYLLATWSAASTYFIGIAIGVDLIFDGAALIGFAGAIRSLPKAQTGAA